MDVWCLFIEQSDGHMAMSAHVTYEFANRDLIEFCKSRWEFYYADDETMPMPPDDKIVAAYREVSEGETWFLTKCEIGKPLTWEDDV